MSEENIEKISLASEDDAKKKLKELSDSYKSYLDDFLLASYKVALCREQINNCLELIALYQKEKSETQNEE